jgi:hypothetical protein
MFRKRLLTTVVIFMASVLLPFDGYSTDQQPAAKTGGETDILGELSGSSEDIPYVNVRKLLLKAGYGPYKVRKAYKAIPKSARFPEVDAARERAPVNADFCGRSIRKFWKS